MSDHPATAASEPVVHQGTFAEGESSPETYPGEEHVGTFAESS